MSEIKLQADSGSGTTSIKGPSSTTGNAAREFLLPDVANGTLRTTTTSGAVLQVLQNYRTDMISTTSATFVDVLTQAITPSSTSNKILIFFFGLRKYPRARRAWRFFFFFQKFENVFFR